MKQVISLLLTIIVTLSSCDRRNSLTDEDIADIEFMMHEYREAWKQGDSVNVMNKISPDIMLFQTGKSSKPIFGKKEVSDFWFPKSDISYPIIEYVISHKEINGSGDFAYYQGVSKLSWYTLNNNIASDSSTVTSEFISILKKYDNEWKIYRQMYNIKDLNYDRSFAKEKADG